MELDLAIMHWSQLNGSIYQNVHYHAHDRVMFYILRPNFAI